MTPDRYLALIQAEIDGELDGGERSELARQLLADPSTRAVRDQLHRLCEHLDEIEYAEPPAELRANILQALPPATVPLTRYRKSLPRWRYAALIAGLVGAGALVFETVRGPGPATSEMAGTMAAAGGPVALDTVSLGSGPVIGRVSLHRDGAGLSVALELAAEAPVDVLVVSEGRTLRINGLGRQSGSAGPSVVALPGPVVSGQAVELTFLISGQQVGRATLKVPVDR
jgi:anti-sigma factor RsiW